MRRLLTAGFVFGLALLQVSRLHAHGIHHHRGVLVPAGGYAPAGLVVSPGVSFVQPSGFAVMPSGFASFGGFGGASFGYMHMTGVPLVPATGFSGASFGCFGGSAGGGPTPATGSFQSSSFNASNVIDIIRLLRELFGPRGSSSDGATDSDVASQLKKINARLNAIDKKLDLLLQKKTGAGNAGMPGGIVPPEFQPGPQSKLTAEQPVSAIHSAVYAAHQAKMAAGNARKAYEAAVQAHNTRTTRLQNEEEILKGLKKVLTALGEKVE